jgi:hypothetical protein
MNIRPARSRHCHYCNCCVMKFDHHCLWINNCVGALNIGKFYLFIFFIWLSLGLSLALSVIVFIYTPDSGIIIQVPRIGTLIIAAVTGVFGLLLIFPISYMLFVQTLNLSRNQTTSERYSNAHLTRPNLPSESNCFLINCFKMCCNADSKVKERNTKIFSLVSNQNDMSDYQMIEEEEITIPITE